MANHQNFKDDINWLHYFDLDHTFYFGDFTFEHEYNSCNQSFELPYTNQLSQDQNDVPLLDEFPYFDPIEKNSSSWEWWEIEGFSPLLSNNNDDHNADQCRVTTGEAKGTTTTIVGGGCKRSRSPLELEEIEKCFEMPIAMAANELSVGLTVLKRRCRELNIKRWPYRKLKSLKSLIQNVKELGLNEEIEMLEEQKRRMKKLPEMQYTQRTKKLRQACFKATYKKRRCN